MSPGDRQPKRRHLVAGQAPELLAGADAALELVGERLADAVAARDHAQRAVGGGQRVEVERELDMQRPTAPAVAIGVPARVAGVEVAVAAHVVEVVAQDAGGDAVDARVVEQRAQLLALVDELYAARARAAVVRAAIVPAAVGGPDRLELGDDPVDPVGQQARQRQEAKGSEGRQLLVGQGYGCGGHRSAPLCADLVSHGEMVLCASA